MNKVVALLLLLQNALVLEALPKHDRIRLVLDKPTSPITTHCSNHALLPRSTPTLCSHTLLPHSAPTLCTTKNQSEKARTSKSGKQRQIHAASAEHLLMSLHIFCILPPETESTLAAFFCPVFFFSFLASSSLPRSFLLSSCPPFDQGPFSLLSTLTKRSRGPPAPLFFLFFALLCSVLFCRWRNASFRLHSSRDWQDY